MSGDTWVNLMLVALVWHVAQRIRRPEDPRHPEGYTRHR